MCGIVGVWSASKIDKTGLIEAVRRLGRRGPDDSGVWLDDSNSMGLGFSRLAIIDPSSAGRQPMHSACGRYVMVFNGEIYNHLELRDRLGSRAPDWRGHADTETLLACFSAWGVEKALKATVGMFAVGLWDREKRVLSLARDRLGEKPLYYGFVGDALVFASELGAISALPGFTGDVDRGSIALLLRHNYVPAPNCIYVGLAKLPPGTWLEASSQAIRTRSVPTPRKYWSAIETAVSGLSRPLVFDSDRDAAASLELELVRSISGQLVADVPIGAFLSGGIDSSTVVALMQAQSTRRIKTFSVGFQEADYNEATFAREVARHLGTDHTEIIVTPNNILDTIAQLPTIYNEPFSDSSQIPTFLVSKLARRHVTVALTGDGGDELFGGYSRYFIAARLWARIQRIPLPLRRVLGAAVLAIPIDVLNKIFSFVAPAIPSNRRWREVGVKLHKGAELIGCEQERSLYKGLVSHWSPESVMLNAQADDSMLGESIPDLPTFIDHMMLMDAIGYLPDGILAKLDRAAMAVGLETRVPLIDHRLFEFAWKLPMHYKIRGSVGKWLLRQVLYKYVPRKLIDRPKMGFGVPLGLWLRGPLREWAEHLLDESRLRQQGYFETEVIRSKWREHLSGSHDWQYHLWDVLMFQAWLESTRK